MANIAPTRLVLMRVAAAPAIVLLIAACGSSGARGREIVERMSAALASAENFSVTTDELRQRMPESQSPESRRLTRRTIVKRHPDRLYFETSGDADNQGWYDGVGLTLVLHRDKVFGQARMPETLDAALDAIHERYGVTMPVADFLYSSAARALIADTTTGGWLGREDIDRQPHDHVRFTDKDVTWDLWVPASGPPLPRRFVVDFKERRAANHVEVTFSDWNLAPAVAAQQFEPRVPHDYEGIALLQRASVLRNIPDDGSEPNAEATTSKPAER